MGLIQHDVVIATTWNEEKFNKVFDLFVTLPYVTSNKSVINEYYTIYFGPDGSKEGWDESNKADEWRKKFIKTIENDSSWDYVEVSFGELGETLANKTG